MSHIADPFSGAIPISRAYKPRPAVRRIAENRANDAGGHAARKDYVDPRLIAAEQAKRRIARENVHASRLDPTDARRIMACRVYESLQGGRSAILRPRDRHRLIDLGRSMGLRPFDANLVIAVVQDAARQGEAPTAASPDASLKIVRTPQPQPTSWSVVLSIALAIALGTLMGVVGILWMRGG
ncbi:MAG: hypothetical protein AAGB34_01870 [Planctomycetota bacterium]